MIPRNMQTGMRMKVLETRWLDGPLLPLPNAGMVVFELGSLESEPEPDSAERWVGRGRFAESVGRAKVYAADHIDTRARR